MSKGTMNRKYKDHLFRIIFGENKADLLTLYNAVNNTSYDNPEALEINTIDDVIYIGMKNDISFLIEGTLNLYEHQSSMCGNLPLRGLFYLADIYREYVETRGENIYGSKTIRLPMPQYIVFYNGEKDEPDCTVYDLQDAFFIPENENTIRTPCLDCRVKVLNINYGHNKVLLEKCKMLNEYAIFISEIRKYLKYGNNLRDSVTQAVEICIQNNVLKGLLQKNRAEVESVILTEYNEELHLKSVREEGIEQGVRSGKSEAILMFLSELGEIPWTLKKQILEENNPEVLQRWIKNAARADSVKTFQANM